MSAREPGQRKGREKDECGKNDWEKDEWDKIGCQRRR